MAKLSWITEPGTVANLLIGAPASVILQATDPDDLGASITYSVIYGNLPPGLGLTSDGIIAGSPQYTTPENNYFTTQTYNFTVRAKNAAGNLTSDRSFSIIISNVVNGDFSWVTPAGNLGTIPNGEYYSLQLQAQSSSGLAITYSFISGQLPVGMELVQRTEYFNRDINILNAQTEPGSVLSLFTVATIPIGSIVTGPGIDANTQVIGIDVINQTVQLNKNTLYVVPPNTPINFYGILLRAGTLKGVPTILNPISVDQAQVYRFTIRAMNSAGHVNDRSFSLSVTNVYGPIIRPTTVELGTYFDGTLYNQQLTVTELNPAVSIRWTVKNGELPPGVTLSSTGLLSGYIQPIELIGQYGPSGFDGADKTVLGQTGTMLNSSIAGSVLYIGSVSAGTVLSGMFLSGTGVAAGTQIVSHVTEWDKGQSYGVGDIVTYNTEYYSAQQPIIDNMEFDNIWTVGRSYRKNEIVRYNSLYYKANNDIFASMASTPSSAEWTETTSPWTQTTWSQERPYIVGDAVIRNGFYYLAARSIPTGTAFDNADWDQILEKLWRISPSQYVSSTTITGTVQDTRRVQEFDLGPFDFNQLNQSATYNFTIQAFDGASYDTQDYEIEVVARSGWTADSGTLINNAYLTVDSLNVYLPVLKNVATTLPTGRQNSYYAYKFDGFDFSGDEILYSVTNTAGTFDADPFDTLWEDSYNLTTDLYRPGEIGSFDYVSVSTGNLPGLLLDSRSGWLYGKISPQVSALQNFKFGITVSKIINGVVYSGQSVRFTLPVLGDVNNVIEWVTPSNLGTIDNGAISELSITAKSLQGKELVYSLYDEADMPARLPQGLRLLPTGEISGRVSFEAFTIDNYSTSFDKNTLTIDRTSRFTVQASTIDNTSTTFQEFTLTLKVIDQKPYVNLYLRAMPAFDQRQIYNSVISRTDIFDPNLIYRPTDPWFGINSDIEMLFLPGLNSETLAAYELAITQNHWSKTYNFGEVKSAVVLDDNYKVKYEVVYIEVLDPEENSQGVGPDLTLDLTSVIDNPYIDDQGNEFKVAYPNTSDNMIKRLEQGIGYADQSSLPAWMTSNQLGETATTFNTPLGFTKGVVLAYTIKGASKLIAYRLRTSGVNFNNIEFSVDRYEVDNYYSTWFNPATQQYSGGTETTFDVQPKNNIGKIVDRVNYAVSVPFNEINGRPITYINDNGGIDGVIISELSAGDTLVFAKQENFYNPGPYDGWVEYSDSFIGDNITTGVVEGYDQGGVGIYDNYTVVPGYLEKIQETAVSNRRASVWTINVNNGLIYLTPKLEIELYDRLQVLAGKTYGGAIIYYVSPTLAGQTVPYYTVFKLNKNAIQTPTTFNGGTTKFFTKRDHYYIPNSQDKYLKFPQTGVFN